MLNEKCMDQQCSNGKKDISATTYIHFLSILTSMPWMTALSNGLMLSTLSCCPLTVDRGTKRKIKLALRDIAFLFSRHAVYIEPFRTSFIQKFFHEFMCTDYKSLRLGTFTYFFHHLSDIFWFMTKPLSVE